MPYNGKTNWKLNDTVNPEDMNRIEGQIGKNTSEIEGVSGKIGNPSDGEDQLTLFGKLAAILAKVLGIDTKVGTSDDAKTKPTLFGKIAGIGDILSENLTLVTEKISEVLTKVTGINDKIGTSGDGAEKNTLFGYILSIYKGMSKKCVISKNKQFDVKFSFNYNRSAVTLLMLNRVSDYDGSILIELTNDLGPRTADSYLWAFSESSLMISSSNWLSNYNLKIKELINLPEGSQLSNIWEFPIPTGADSIPNVFYPVSLYKDSSKDFYFGTNQSFCLQVKKGERYFLICGMDSSNNGSSRFSASVYYDVKKV